MSSVHPLTAQPRLLDLFCGAGGAARGYQLAGFHVTGVDNRRQSRYVGNRVFAGDAMNWLREGRHLEYDAIHASPPCPRYSTLTKVTGTAESHPDFVLEVIELLKDCSLPWAVENVPGAPGMESANLLCGSGMGLGADCDDGEYRQLRRHRLFLTNFDLLVPPCVHKGEPIGVYGKGGGQAATARSGRGVLRGYIGTLAESKRAMKIQWMTTREIRDAVPPAYALLVGEGMMKKLTKNSRSL